MLRRLVLALGLALVACASVPALPQGPEDALERHSLLLEAQDGAPLLAGNRVTLLRDGEETFPAMFQAIAAARDHVNLEFYILADVRAPGWQESLFTLLARKLRQGVAVSMLYDSFGSDST